jgi:hypothetical protein
VEETSAPLAPQAVAAAGQAGSSGQQQRAPRGRQQPGAAAGMSQQQRQRGIGRNGSNANWLAPAAQGQPAPKGKGLVGK